MSDTTPVFKTDLTDYDVVVARKHQNKRANGLWRKRIKELLLERGEHFFTVVKLEKRATMIVRDLKHDESNKWQYWLWSDDQNEGNGGYQQADEKTISDWTKTTVKSISETFRKESSKNSGSSSDSFLAAKEVNSQDSQQEGETVDDATTVEVGEDEKDFQKLLGYIGCSEGRRAYERSLPGEAWLSLFQNPADDIEDCDIERLLNSADALPGDFSVRASNSHIHRTDKNEDEPLAKLILNQSSKGKKFVYWFYDTRDGKYYRADLEAGMISKPFDSMGYLLQDLTTSTRFLFKPHDNHGRHICKILSTAADSANTVVDESQSGSKRLRRESANSSTATITIELDSRSIGDLSSLTFRTNSGTTSFSASTSQEINE